MISKKAVLLFVSITFLVTLFNETNVAVKTLNAHFGKDYEWCLKPDHDYLLESWYFCSNSWWLYWVVSDAVIENKAIHLPTYEWPSLDAQGIHIAWIHYSLTGCVVLCWRHALLATMWCFFPPFCSRSSSWLYFLWAYFIHCLTCLSVSLYRALKHVHMLSHTDTPTDSDLHAHTHSVFLKTCWMHTSLENSLPAILRQTRFYKNKHCLKGRKKMLVYNEGTMAAWV